MGEEFKIGDLVVVTKVPYVHDLEHYRSGHVGRYEGESLIDFNIFRNSLKHYTPIEDLPLWKSNHMYLDDEQQQALRKLLHRVQWDEEYAEKIGMNSLDNNSIIMAFTWEDTEEGQSFWEAVDEQCVKGAIQKPDEIRSRAMGGVVDELCPTVTPCTITIDGLNNTSEYFLQRAIDLQKERGKEYDNGTERSMHKTVEVFNIITGKQLSESEGWLFMQVLKDVRQWTKPEYHQDSAEDCVSYAALKAEALASGK